MSEVVPVQHKEHTLSSLHVVAVLSFSFPIHFLLVPLLHSGLTETLLNLLIRGHLLYFFSSVKPFALQSLTPCLLDL